MADELFDVRNALTVGNYHQAISDGSAAKTNLRKPDEVAAFNAEKEAALARAQIGLGQFDAVLTQLRTATHPLLVSVRAWAEFAAAIKANPVTVAGAEVAPSVSAALGKLTSAAEEIAPDTVYKAIFATAALLQVRDYAGALTLAKKWLSELPEPQGAAATRTNVELRGLVVEGLLRLNRPDQAQSEVQTMEKVDEEALVTLLSIGVVALHIAQTTNSKEHYGKALTSFREVSMRCGQSVMVLNLIALAQMGQKDYEAAERSLLDALAIRSGDEDTAANLAVVSAHLSKATETSERYAVQASTAGGAWSSAYKVASANLEEAIKSFEG